MTCPAYADVKGDAADLGVDYAFLFLMSLSPDIAAAHYKIDNPDGSQVQTAIGRLPYRVSLSESASRSVQFEVAVARQETRQSVVTYPDPGEGIDSAWMTYGGSLGLLYEQTLIGNLRLAPSLRVGWAQMDNDARYHGTLTSDLREEFDGILLNWHTSAKVLNLGLGLRYDWELGGRKSRLNADVYRVKVDSFEESNPAIRFSEQAGMAVINADMVFPTHYELAGKRLDLVLMLGSNSFFGENRRTLGYTTSYQLGAGSELPLLWRGERYGYVRMGGLALWADNMRGWLLTLGYRAD